MVIAPLDVACRQSTDITAIADALVAKAVRFIREHACDGINVEDVLAHCWCRAPVCRTVSARRCGARFTT